MRATFSPASALFAANGSRLYQHRFGQWPEWWKTRTSISYIAKLVEIVEAYSITVSSRARFAWSAGKENVASTGGLFPAYLLKIISRYLEMCFESSPF